MRLVTDDWQSNNIGTPFTNNGRKTYKIIDKELYLSTEDSSNDFDEFELEDIKRVYRDLSKRKYGFQFNSVPPAHTAFMKLLKEYLHF